MKKILSLIIVLAVPFVFLACGEDKETTNNTPQVPVITFPSNTSPALITASNVQTIVDSTATIDNTFNAMDEVFSFMDNYNGQMVVSGCGGTGTVVMAYAIPLVGGDGGSLKGTFNNFAVFDPNGNGTTDCLAGATILAGTIEVTVNENWTWSTTCNCDVGTSSGTGSVAGIRITKADGSDRTFNGIFTSVENSTDTQSTETITSTMSVTNNTLPANKLTTLKNYSETFTYNRTNFTSTGTFSGTLYTPIDGKVDITTTTPMTEVSNTITQGTVALASGGVTINLDIPSMTWAADLNADSDMADAGESGAMPLVMRH